MHTYFVTSREGLFLLDATDAVNPVISKVHDGKYFGIAVHHKRWYTIRYVGCKNIPSNTGLIESFMFSDGVIDDLRVEAEGLDNGSHQLVTYQDKLYLLETYYQRIRIFCICNISGKLTVDRVIYPYDSDRFVNAHYMCNGLAEQLARKDLSCSKYLHMNAITIQDNLVYISCPRLRNSIDAQGRPSHSPQNHCIMVYDMNFNYLWEHCLNGEVFCHDLVFRGSYIYITSPPNKIIRYSIITKSKEVVCTFPDNMRLPRGLSIRTDGMVISGFREPGCLYIYRIDTVNGLFDDSFNMIRVKTPNKMEPCCIVNLDENVDFVHTCSVIRRPYVVQLKSDLIMGNMFNTLVQLRGKTFEQDWTIAQPTLKVRNECKKYTTKQYDVDEIINPSEDIFNRYKTYQSTIYKKLSLVELPNEKRVNGLMTHYSSFEREIMNSGLFVSGKLFMYLPGHHLGWHTNLEDPNNIGTYRCYTVFCTKDNETFFLYRHPISKQIHAVPDRDLHTNIFYLGSKRSPLWHSVINPSRNTTRASIGILVTSTDADTTFKEFQDILTGLRHSNC